MTPSVVAQVLVTSQSRSQLEVPEAQQLIQADQVAASLDPKSASFLSPNSFLTWGPVIARPHLTTSFTYGNSIRSSSGQNANTVIEQISPGSLLQLGKKWALDYTPTLSFYSSRDFKDTLGHNVALAGNTSYENWSFGLTQTYSQTTQPLLETGRQTEQQVFATAINASHYFNSSVMLELGVNQAIQDAEQFSSSRTWSTMNWLNFQIAPRLSIGAGLGGGYQSVSSSFDMSYEQFQVRVNSRIAQKLTLSINGGGEVRQILDAHADPLINPVYGMSVIYKPFEVTTLSLSGNRAISASLIQSEISESASISAAINQRLLGAVFLTLSGTYSNTRFVQSSSSLALNREDDTVSFSANLSYAFTRRASGSIFYTHSDNSSSLAGFGFSSHQVGLSLAYRF